MKKKGKIFGLLSLLVLFGLSLTTFNPIYAEEEIPFIELQAIEPLTQEQREEKELRRFTRGLKELLQEEEKRIVIKDGVYIDIDTLLNVRRPIPDLPLAISIANATERDELLLREVKLLGPWRTPIRSFAFERSLKPMGRSFARLGALREEIRLLERRAALEGRITLQQKETLSKIQEERAQLFSQIGAESSHTQATFDPTPYLKEVGDEATITIQASFAHNGRPLTVERTFTYTRTPPLPDREGWSRGDFHIHSVFSDAGSHGPLPRDAPYSIWDATTPALAAGLDAIAITDHDDDIARRYTKYGTGYYNSWGGVTPNKRRKKLLDGTGWVRLENPAGVDYGLSFPFSDYFYLTIVYESEITATGGRGAVISLWDGDSWDKIRDATGTVIRLKPETHENWKKFRISGQYIRGEKVGVRIETGWRNITYIRYVEIERPKPEETKVGIPPHYYSRYWPGLNEGTWAGYLRDIERASMYREHRITYGITVIPGVEFGRDEGHYLAYGLKSFRGLRERDGQNTIEHVSRLGGFGYIAHPLGGWGKDWDDLGTRRPPFTGYTGLEVWNAGCLAGDMVAVGKWDYLLRREGKEGRKVFGIGNSDAHHLGSIGDVFNFVRTGISPDIAPAPDKVLNALRAGQVVFGLGPFLDFQMGKTDKPGEETVGLGGTLTVPFDTTEVWLRFVKWEDYNKLFNHIAVIEISNTGSTVIWDRGTAGLPSVFRLRIPITNNTICIRLEGWDTANNKVVVFTNPIWIEFSRPPRRPTNISPAHGARNVSLTPTLRASAFSDPDWGDTHLASQWIVRRADNNALVWDSGWRTANLTSITVPSGKLEHNTTYRWYVRYADNHETPSQPSWATTFTTKPAPLADLTVPSVSFSPSTARHGEAIEVTFSVKNQGDSPSGPFHYQVSLATTPWGATHNLGEFSTASLAGGASRPITRTVTIPSGIPIRDYYVTVWVDNRQVIAEAKEDNNIGSSTPSRLRLLAAVLPPRLHVTPTAVSGRLVQDTGWTTIGTVNVTNPGGGTLRWSATDDKGWIRISPSSGNITTGKTPVTVEANAIGLAVGTHRGKITFRGASPATGSPDIVEVTVTVIPTVVVPTVETRPARSITATSATLNARITSDGGAPILERKF
ncbi:hypothetical protein LR007_02200, partial [candidate division NPL-UPA2 bacterium]|nr:hypothetical protein [candidate division NPL-UPA2 bacterium]